MTPTLCTERLVLSPYTPEDEDDFVALLADKDVSKWMVPAGETEATIRLLFRRIFTEVYERNLFDVWAVRMDGRFIGHAEIKPTGNVDGHEMALALARDAWGKGIGTELIKAVMRYGADVLKLTEVYGMVGGENVASLAMARRLGFDVVREIANEDGTTTLVVTAPLKSTTPAQS